MDSEMLMSPSKRKVPVVYQIEAAECGAASLCMILAYYGRYVDLPVMRRECRISRDGSRMIDVVNAAEKYGMRAEGFFSGSALRNRKLPAIALWKHSHFLVVEKLSDKWVWIVDPAHGRRKITKDEFAEGFSGIILEVEPTEKFKPGGRPHSILKPVMKLVRFHGRGIASLACISVMINILGVIIPGFTTLFVDYYLPFLSSANLTTFFAAFAIALLIEGVLLVIKKHVNLKYRRYQSANMTATIVGKLLRLPLRFFNNRSHSAIDMHLNDIDSLTDFLSAKLIPILIDTLFSVIFIVLLFLYSVQVAIPTILLLTLIGVLLLVLLRMSRSTSVYSSNQQVEFYTSVVQNVRLFNTIKSVAMEDEAFMESVKKHSAYRNAMQASQKILSVIQAVPVIVPLLIQVFVIAVGSEEVIRGAMSVGEVLACQIIAVSIFNPVIQIISEFSALQSQQMKVNALEDIMSEEEDPSLTDSKSTGTQALSGSIRVENVTFGYNESLPPVVKNISLQIGAGKSAALVGSSGSGKSTILKLIEGLYQPASGQILFDGVPRAEINRTVLQGSMASVTQVPFVFTGTVRENITLVDRNIDMRAVTEATKAACIYDAIEAHADGFNAVIGSSESSFSGGEIQRMMIARALIRKPSILILDEATSALDTVVEEQIMKNIRAMNITLIVVAHRLSTIRDCDEIIVLRKGEIIQRGSHAELAAQEGVYKDLMTLEEDNE